MNYKKRLTLLFVGLFFFVLTAILSFIYIAYADFRRGEFFERLRQKSFSTVKLLAEVNEIDRDLLKIIDRNMINKLYDEKILIFNENNDLIYSSLDDETIPYSKRLIDQLRNTEDKFYVDDDGDEVVGVHYREHGHDYVVLASAYDLYGISKLRNLRDLVIGALVGGTLLIALSSYFYIRQVFRPIDQLNHSIQLINVDNLREFVTVRGLADELDELASNYNQMLRRLYKAFELQQSFVRNASHELKTPLAIMQGKLEKLHEMCFAHDEAGEVIESLMDEMQGQASLVESLLLIQRLQSEIPIQTTAIRFDEALDDTVREVKQNFPSLHVQVDIDGSISTEKHLTVVGNMMLMKTCLKNLATNAALYADTSELIVRIGLRGPYLDVSFVNEGSEELPPDIFQPFFRQASQQEKPGSGLGLSIVSEVVGMMNGSILYSFSSGHHTFSLRIPHSDI